MSNLLNLPNSEIEQFSELIFFTGITVKEKGVNVTYIQNICLNSILQIQFSYWPYSRTFLFYKRANSWLSFVLLKIIFLLTSKRQLKLSNT